MPGLGFDLALPLRSGRVANEEAPHLHGRDDGDTEQQRADGRCSDPVEHRLPVTSVSMTATRSKPPSRGPVLNSGTGAESVHTRRRGRPDNGSRCRGRRTMMWTRRCASVAGLVTLAVTLPALLADARTLSESPRAEVLGAARAEALRDAGETDRLSGAASATISSPTDAIPAVKAKKRPKKSAGRATSWSRSRSSESAAARSSGSRSRSAARSRRRRSRRHRLPRPLKATSRVTWLRPSGTCRCAVASRSANRRPGSLPRDGSAAAAAQPQRPAGAWPGEQSDQPDPRPVQPGRHHRARLDQPLLGGPIQVYRHQQPDPSYWNLTLNGAALTGTLAQDHREEAAAFNLLAAHVELAPCFPQFGTFVNQLAIAEGATLTGTITPRRSSCGSRATPSTPSTRSPRRSRRPAPARRRRRPPASPTVPVSALALSRAGPRLRRPREGRPEHG